MLGWRCNLIHDRYRRGVNNYHHESLWSHTPNKARPSGASNLPQKHWQLLRRIFKLLMLQNQTLNMIIGDHSGMCITFDERHVPKVPTRDLFVSTRHLGADGTYTGTGTNVA